MRPYLLIGILLFFFFAGCNSNSPGSSNSLPGAAAEPKDGDYHGAGKITEINKDAGLIELDHGDIPGLMPAMKMMFYVSDKELLNGLAIGDNVDFVILYKKGTETVTQLTKK